MVDLAWLAGMADRLARESADGLVPHELAVERLCGCAGRDAVVLREAVALVHADAAVVLLHEAAMAAEEPPGSLSDRGRR